MTFLVRAAAALVAIALVGLAAAGLGWIRCRGADCPDVERLRTYQPGGASKLLDRHGRAFAELRPVEVETAPLGSIPEHVRDAFVAIEDQRFYDHGGVDWRRVFGAVAANVRAGGVREGFSTITMQLARNVFPDRLRAEERTMGRKFTEVRVAYEIESQFSKDEILELYLSHIYFGNGARGIEAAATYYFGVTASQLSLAEAAMLAALPKGPAFYDPRRHPNDARERRDLVLTMMEEQERITPADAEAARSSPVRTRRVPMRPSTEPEPAPWFVEHVRQEAEDLLGEYLYAEGLQIVTTLDLSLQQAAEQELDRQLRALDITAPGIEGAFVALDPQSGDVLAWIGGRDFTRSRFDRAKNARRQIGSAFKPFVYAAALGEGHTLNEQINDRPIAIQLAPTKTWEPQNFDRHFAGAVTLRDALVFSKNVPTIELASDVGLQDVAAVARQAGISSAMDLTPAMPLGTVAGSPLELARAYTPFATLGTAVSPRYLLSIKNKDDQVLWQAPEPTRREVLNPAIAYMVTDVLRDAIERGSGVAVRATGFTAPAAGKTGTTNSATDVWFVGYTPSIVAVVWMGHDQPKRIGTRASGGRLAAPVWARILMRTNVPRAADWAKPDRVVERWIDAATGSVLGEGCRSVSGVGFREVFLRSRMPAESCPQHGEMFAAERTPFPPEEEQLIDEWPTEIGGRSFPVPAEEAAETDSLPRIPGEEPRQVQPTPAPAPIPSPDPARPPGNAPAPPTQPIPGPRV